MGAEGAAKCVCPMARILLPVQPLAILLLPCTFWTVSAGASVHPTASASAAAGVLVLGRDDLLRVQTAFARINDDLRLIMSVLGEHLTVDQSHQDVAYASLQAEPRGLAESNPKEEAHPHPDILPMPREPSPEPQLKPQVVASTSAREFMRTSVTWAMCIGEWAFSFGIFGLDVGIVIGMQLFLDSVGRKKGGSSVMSKANAANALAAKVGGTPPGAHIPAPSMTPPPSSTQRLSVLSQEELLAACLTEHWGKLALGLGLAVACRLPPRLLNNQSLLCHMLVNLAVMLRCMSLVMLLIRDDMTLPRKERRDNPTYDANSG